jgi:DNA modification methylase
MTDVGHPKTYQTAARRWEGVGPYYAMFPTDFADRVVAKYTKPGDTVLDPFAGRGTAVFSAAHQGRRGLGIEINPVGWVYAKTKLGPAPRDAVARRLRELGE